MVKSIIKFSIPNIINMLLGLLGAVVLTRFFSTEEYGVINIYNATVTTIWSALCLGLDQSYIRYYNEPPHDDDCNELGGKLLAFVLATTMICCGCSLVWSSQISRYFFNINRPILWYMVIVCSVGQIVLRFVGISYRMTFNSRMFGIQQVLTQVVTKFSYIVGALLALSVVKSIVIQALMVLIFAIIFFGFTHRNFVFSKLQFVGYKKVFVFGFLTFPISFCLNVNTLIMQQIISKSIGIDAVGIYSSANYFCTVLIALGGGFSTYWAAYMFANYKDNQEKIKQVNGYILLAMSILLAGMIIFKDVLYLFIGPNFQDSKKFFSLVILAPILSIACETSSYGTSIKEKNHITLIIYIIYVILGGLLTALLTPVFGLMGAAFASAVAGIGLYFARTVVGQKYYASIVSMRNNCIGIIAIIVMACIPVLLPPLVANIVIILIIVIELLLCRERVATVAKMFIGWTKNLRGESK